MNSSTDEPTVSRIAALFGRAVVSYDRRFAGGLENQENEFAYGVWPCVNCSLALPCYPTSKTGGQADLSYPMLQCADLEGTNFRDAILSPVILDHATLKGADLSNSDLTGAVLTGAYLENTSLSGVVFEPRGLPPPEYIAAARHLELMTYESNPGPLTQLRKQFQDAGYREQERAITYAINRRPAALESPIERRFKRVAFDVTCQYGFTPGRPLRVVLWAVAGLRNRVRRLHAPPRQFRHLSGRHEVLAQQVDLPRNTDSAARVSRRQMVAGSVAVATKGAASPPRRGLFQRWARTVSGFQPLLSVYLIALWVLTYFGRPFG
jgi:hypothetical protein